MVYKNFNNSPFFTHNGILHREYASVYVCATPGRSIGRLSILRFREHQSVPAGAHRARQATRNEHSYARCAGDSRKSCLDLFLGARTEGGIVGDSPSLKPTGK